MSWLALLALGCAAGPAWLFLRNLSALRPPPEVAAAPARAAILIPARNEERNILAALQAALGSGAAEVLVLDDGSSDRTAEIVRQRAAGHPEIRLLTGEPLPAGWGGKNFACAQLAAATEQPILIFADADVCLAPGSAARLVAFLAESGAALASGVPRQVTVTFSEQLLVPLIHFVLLGFLPLERMRASNHPAYGTGCGQLFVAGAEAYRKSGGHGAIRGSLHDGLTLPRNFRRSGFRTDLFDATEVAVCRMFRGEAEVWRGLSRNTTEGLGAPALIVPATLLLLLGQVAPFGLLGAAGPIARSLGAAAVVCALLPRIVAVVRFRQPLLGLVLHPLGILALLGIQWFGWARRFLGRPARWKGRSLGEPA